MNIAEVNSILKDATVVEIVGDPLEYITILLILSNKNKAMLKFKLQRGVNDGIKWLETNLSLIENIENLVIFTDLKKD